MKTQIIFATVASLLITNVAVAQYYSSSDNVPDQRDIFQFGIKAGANNSNLYDTKGQEFTANPIFGPVFGAFLSIPLGRYLGIQPEVLYSSKGYSGSGTLSNEELPTSSTTTVTVKGDPTVTATGAGTPGQVQDYSYINRLNFIDVPIMLQIKPFTNLYLLAGPEYSYLISSSYTFTQGVTSETTQQQFQNENLRHNIFGLIFGIDLNLGRWLTLGGRVAWDEVDNNGDGTSNMPQYRNIWGQATIGYRF